ncbi:S41 family peptidase [soil metagenome]
MKHLFTSPRKLFFSLFLTLGVSVSFGFSDRLFEIARHLDLFATVFREVNRVYVEEVSPGQLLNVGVEAMLSSLDPYTEFVDERHLEDYRMNYVTTQYAGIGASFFTKENQVIVGEPLEGFAAHKGDLRAGDVLLKINGISLEGKTYEEVNTLLKGQTNTTIRLLVERQGEPEPLDKVIVRETITSRNVPYYGMLTDEVGYIKLNRFLINSAREVREAFLSLKEKNKMTSLVLDLRGNGGGIVQESVSIVNLFVERGQPIVVQKGRTKKTDMVYKAIHQPLDARMPLVVLVDENSASASEIVAGAIQDLDRGSIIGQRTFGKGLVQQTMPISHSTLLKLTVGRYLTPTGRCLQALDYAHRDEEGNGQKWSDSLLREYKTRHGRVVYDGSGICPDIVTKEKKRAPIVQSLLAQSLPFAFSTLYRSQHPSISSPRTFQVSDSTYAAFVRFVAGRNVGYASTTELALADLKSQALETGQFGVIQAEIEALQEKITRSKQEDLFTYKEEIKQVLENEIVARYYLQTGKTQASFKHDPDLAEAIRVLHDPKLYVSILRGDGPFKVIGRPKADALVKANAAPPGGRN